MTVRRLTSTLPMVGSLDGSTAISGDLSSGRCTNHAALLDKQGTSMDQDKNSSEFRSTPCEATGAQVEA